jgi:hypothetical protein
MVDTNAPDDPVRDQILRAVGRPADFLRLDVHRIAGNLYRFNLWVKVGDWGACRVAESKTFRLDEAGVVKF